MVHKDSWYPKWAWLCDNTSRFQGVIRGRWEEYLCAITLQDVPGEGSWLGFFQVLLLPITSPLCSDSECKWSQNQRPAKDNRGEVSWSQTSQVCVSYSTPVLKVQCQTKIMKNGVEFHWSKVIFIVVFAWSRNDQITKKLPNIQGFVRVLYQLNHRMKCKHVLELLDAETK